VSQLTIFDYPNHPGSKDKDTGLEAAEAIAPRAAGLRALVLRCLINHGPMTADETAERLNLSPLAIRPRFTELLRDDAITDSGIRRKNATGRSAKVWRITNVQLSP
jgi:predicted ArsR family transcriptional regulator